MATKAKKQQEESASTDNAALGQMLAIALLSPSPTNPRKRFPESSLDELAVSIKEQGVIEPLIVREKWNTVVPPEQFFEIVCGERRYRASQKAGLTELPCIIRELTDEQVLDIQIHENLHREDVHPMDEAYGYKFLMETLNCDVKEVALRVGKSEAFVLNRLKLNSLIQEAQDDIEAGHLPLVYALEIAKFPAETQLEILENGTYETDWDYQERKYAPNRSEIAKFSEFKDFINNEILLRLDTAKFDTKATNLRSDGLSCVACPDRTGATQGLFEADLVGKNDSCLNKTCFEAKSQRLVEISREKIAHENSVEIEAVPFVHSAHYSAGVGVYGREDFVSVGKKKPFDKFYGSHSQKTCDTTVTALDLSSDHYLKPMAVCVDIECKVHRRQTSSSSSNRSTGSEKSAKEKEQFYGRKEEIWNVKIGEAVRKQVFAQAAPKFAETFTVTGGGDKFTAAMCAKLMELYADNYIARRIKDLAVSIVRESMSLESLDLSSSYGEGPTREEKISKLSDSKQKALFYLLIHCGKGDMGSGNWSSQREVKEIAKEWEIDYRLIDANVRVSLSPKKHLEAHKVYLAAVESGDHEVVRPALYSEKWNRDQEK